ncbi:hypothetical protein BDV10DRAFT_175526 [Aspergillus recurvatus]
MSSMRNIYRTVVICGVVVNYLLVGIVSARMRDGEAGTAVLVFLLTIIPPNLITPVVRAVLFASDVAAVVMGWL